MGIEKQYLIRLAVAITCSAVAYLSLKGLTNSYEFEAEFRHYALRLYGKGFEKVTQFALSTYRIVLLFVCLCCLGVDIFLLLNHTSL
jgi:hypothetical protein